MKSTSIHTLSADSRWILPIAPVWFLLNWISNRFCQGSDSELIVRQFVPDLSKADRADRRESPSRILCNLFWAQLPWEKILEDLGEINIFDTGCGSGTYGIKLQSYSGNRVHTYTGIDIKEHSNWSVLRKDPRFRFFRVDSADILSVIPDNANLFVTQSSVEHFREDLTYFRQLHQFVTRHRSRSILQIHLVPSSACLRLYLTHGVRQYTPRTIGYITSLFAPNSTSVLYALGGHNCNAVHWEYVTRPLFVTRTDWRLTRTDEYEKKVSDAIGRDSCSGSSRHQPSFYALMIQSNQRETATLF